MRHFSQIIFVPRVLVNDTWRGKSVDQTSMRSLCFHHTTVAGHVDLTGGRWRDRVPSRPANRARARSTTDAGHDKAKTTTSKLCLVFPGLLRLRVSVRARRARACLCVRIGACWPLCRVAAQSTHDACLWRTARWPRAYCLCARVRTRFCVCTRRECDGWVTRSHQSTPCILFALCLLLLCRVAGKRFMP